ncbi:MAG TPA: hypothetical protein VFU25_03375 [Ornithinibacter sp.]|nr:hypothetical protein [Ornithinibacter sp.]
MSVRPARFRDLAVADRCEQINVNCWSRACCRFPTLTSTPIA